MPSGRHAVGLHATDSPQSVYCIMCQPALYGRKSTILICTRCFAKIESLTGGREEKRVSSTAYATAAAAAAVILSPCQIMGIWSAREGILAGGQEDESTPCAAISQPPSSSSLPASTAPRFGDLVCAGRIAIDVALQLKRRRRTLGWSIGKRPANQSSWLIPLNTFNGRPGTPLFLFHYMYGKAKIWTSQILRLAILKSVKLSLIDDKLSAGMALGLKIWEGLKRIKWWSFGSRRGQKIASLTNKLWSQLSEKKSYVVKKLGSQIPARRMAKIIFWYLSSHFQIVQTWQTQTYLIPFW